MLEQAIAASNQAEPDLVVLTGDYVTDNPARFTSWYYDSNICKVALAFMPYWATRYLLPRSKKVQKAALVASEFTSFGMKSPIHSDRNYH